MIVKITSKVSISIIISILVSPAFASILVCKNPDNIVNNINQEYGLIKTLLVFFSCLIIEMFFVNVFFLILLYIFLYLSQSYFFILSISYEIFLFSIQFLTIVSFLFRFDIPLFISKKTISFRYPLDSPSKTI